MKKRLIFMVLCVFSCMMLLVACAKKETVSEESNPNAEQFKAIGEDFMRKWIAFDFAKPLDEFTAEYPDVTYVFPTQEELETWYDMNNSVLSDVDKYLELVDGSVSYVDDKEHAKVEARVKCENGEAIFAIHFDLVNKGIQLTAEKVATLAEKMEKAALNTAFGMFFIFTVLIFISLVIKALSILPKLFAPKEEPKKEAAPVAEPVAVQEVESGISEEELTAVMTAAIMAYMAEHDEAPADGLFVRSIKRRTTSAWKRA